MFTRGVHVLRANALSTAFEVISQDAWAAPAAVHCGRQKYIRVVVAEEQEELSRHKIRDRQRVPDVRARLRLDLLDRAPARAGGVQREPRDLWSNAS